MKAKAVLTIQVYYDLNDTPLEELESLLKHAAFNMASNGLLSGHTPADVDTWDCKVTINPYKE